MSYKTSKRAKPVTGPGKAESSPCGAGETADRSVYAGKTGANRRQVGGSHYKRSRIEHWDWAAAEGLDYFQGAITKYVARWRDKNGVEDLEKALHYLEKYIEVSKLALAEQEKAARRSRRKK